MKGYRNRQATPEEESERISQAFFFPKHVPPISIEADSQEEAKRRLAELDNQKEV